MWNGDNDPQEIVIDNVDPSALEPLLYPKNRSDRFEGDIIARCNQLLLVVQQQQEQIEALNAAAEVDADTIARLKRESIYGDV